jgi:hypothetical protein
LSLRAFVTNFYKEYQSNLIMTVPFGGLNYRDITPGVSLTYQQPLAANVRLDAVAGYTFGRGQTQDLATCTYDWFGRCTSDRDPSKQRNQLYLDHNSYARMRLEYKPHAEHTLRLALAPSYVSRDGKDRLYDGKGRDPLTADRALWGFVNGLEYQLDLFDNRLENIAFIKQYMQGLSAEEVAIGNLFRRRDRDTHRFGAGDGLRYRAIDWLWLKASYEYATRLPSPEEVFGDGILIDSNIALAPEVSHNANLGFQLDARNTSAGAFRATLNGFYRNADQLIMLLGSAAKQTFQNVYAARSTGIEAAIGWSSRGEYVAIDANFTQQSFRNRSDQGAFGSYKGDRIPSQPYLFANASVRLQFPELFAVRDQLVLFWTSRYVHSFYRGWESVGDPDTKQVIPAQLVHAAGFGYMVKNAQQRSLTFSLELQNLTDERVYDYYGSQRPGRAVYAKTTASF